MNTEQQFLELLEGLPRRFVFSLRGHSEHF
jgi:hypothetical protein